VKLETVYFTILLKIAPLPLPPLIGLTLVSRFSAGKAPNKIVPKFVFTNVFLHFSGVEKSFD
jgi:hypothetical protein